MTRRYASGALISRPQRGITYLDGTFNAKYRKWLNNRRGHLLGRSFRALQGVSYLDTGHLLGGVLLWKISQNWDLFFEYYGYYRIFVTKYYGKLRSPRPALTWPSTVNDAHLTPPPLYQ